MDMPTTHLKVGDRVYYQPSELDINSKNFKAHQMSQMQGVVKSGLEMRNLRDPFGHISWGVPAHTVEWATGEISAEKPHVLKKIPPDTDEESDNDLQVTPEVQEMLKRLSQPLVEV